MFIYGDQDASLLTKSFYAHDIPSSNFPTLSPLNLDLIHRYLGQSPRGDSNTVDLPNILLLYLFTPFLPASRFHVFAYPPPSRRGSPDVMGTENNSRVWEKSDFLRVPAGWRKFLDRGCEFWVGPNGQKTYQDPRDGSIPDPWMMHLGPTGEAFFHNTMEDRVTWTDPRFSQPSLTVAELSSRHGYSREWRNLLSHLQSRPSGDPACDLWARLVNSQPRDSSIRYAQAFSPPRQSQGHQQVSTSSTPLSQFPT